MVFTYKAKKKPSLYPVYNNGMIDYESEKEEFVSFDYYVPDEKVKKIILGYISKNFLIAEDRMERLFDYFDLFDVFTSAYLEELKQEFWGDALNSFKEGE